MRDMLPHKPPARLRTYLAAGYVLFIVYASLSPFSGWQEQGLDFLDVLSAPLSQTYTWFDAVVNLLAYLPFGLLLGLAFQSRLGVGWSVLAAVLCGGLLSASMEYAQMYLPSRISSNLDMLTNASGTLAGALLAAAIAPRGWYLTLTHWRRWLFHRGSAVDFGLALVVVWVFAQVNPSLPILGNVFLREVARQPFMAPPAEPFKWLESLAVVFNLLMLGTLLLTLLRQRRDALMALMLVLCTVVLVKFVAAALLLKSWALLLWLNAEAMIGIIVGLLLLFACMWISRNAAKLLAVFAALGHLSITFFLRDNNDPASARAIYHWHYGHLLNYNGLSQTILLAFPFLLLVYMWRIRNR
jgi:VanZ family protein